MSSPKETSLLYTAGEGAAVKTAEGVANRALDAIIGFTSKKYNEIKIDIGVAFERYLYNASNRYNKVRTLATGSDPRSIIGEDSIYVSIGVNHNESEVSTASVNNLLEISKDLLILGTGGVGKSMLMRYLFLKSAEEQDYVPILLELRRIDRQTSGSYSIMELIFSCLQEFDAEIPRDQFEYSLRSGKYLFLLDGFDEVKESSAAETAEAIQSFCSKYPKNPCIITSRPRQEVAPLETFTVVHSQPLTKEQAIELASKIGTKDEKTREFCSQLEDELYEKHKDFAENPLLLSMMFLTFMRNSSVPDHLSDFYQKAYDALYSAHDGQDKGFYRRDFRCKTIDEGQFKLLFAYFCFHSFFEEKYEFSYEEIIGYLNRGIEKQSLKDVAAEDVLVDLRNAVCMIICDGETYRFSHRSFQDYFAAYYTSHVLTDEQQRQLFKQKLSDGRVFLNEIEYYELLLQIEPERFKCNALENGLRALVEELNNAPNPDVLLLRSMYGGVHFVDKDNNARFLGFGILKEANESHYFGNIASLFMMTHKGQKMRGSKQAYDRVVECVETVAKSKRYDKMRKAGQVIITFEAVDNITDVSSEDKEAFFLSLCQYLRIEKLRASIEQWLSEVELERRALSKPNFIMDL